MEQPGPARLVPARQQQRHTKGAAHGIVVALTEAQRQVTQRLRSRLERQRLVVREAVVLSLHARVLHHRARIRSQAAHGARQVRVHLHDLLDAAGLEQRRRDALLNSQHHALGRADADRSRAKLRGRLRVSARVLTQRAECCKAGRTRRTRLDGLDGVLHLSRPSSGRSGERDPGGVSAVQALQRRVTRATQGGLAPGTGGPRG